MPHYTEPAQFPNNADDIGWLIDPDESNPAVLHTWYPESNNREFNRVTLRPRFIHGPDGPGWHWHPAGEEPMAGVFGRQGVARTFGLDTAGNDWVKPLNDLHMDWHIGRPLNPKELWIATDGREGEPPSEVDWRPTESIPEDFYGYARSQYDAEDYFTAPDVQPVTVRPKDYLGRELDDEMIDWARRDEQIAGEVRSIAHPDEHAALDALIGDMGKSFTVPAPTAEPASAVPDVQPTEPTGSREPVANPTVPDMQPAETQSVGQPLRWESPQHFEESLAEAMGHGHADENVRRERSEAGRAVAGRLPRVVYERLSQGRVTSVVSHPTLKDVGDAWARLEGGESREVGGYYDGITGEIAVNGDDPAGALAHELGHAFESSQIGPDGYWQISSSDEWKSAWRRELGSGDLSDYAATDPQEGFAEFCRLLWAEPNGKKIASLRYKRCYVLATKYGMI